MEKCKVSELTEQNITDEEKTAAATRKQTHRSRYMNCWIDHANERMIKRKVAYVCRLIICSPSFLCRPFLDMVYSALDCTNDDYHALFVLCLLYAVSHSKGRPLLSFYIHFYGCYRASVNVPEELLSTLKSQWLSQGTWLTQCNTFGLCLCFSYFLLYIYWYHAK